MDGAITLIVPLDYFIAIWYVLWPFGTFKVNWYKFSPFWYVAPSKIWQPCFGAICT
jgi:hypothetical protein